MLTRWLANLRRRLALRRLRRCRDLANAAKERGDMEAYHAWWFAFLVLRRKLESGE